MSLRGLREGDPVIYRVTKRSESPGPRAHEIIPDAHGDGYRYRVEKFWRVGKILDGGKILLYTRRGKWHVCDERDRNLRRAGLVKYLFNQHKFPAPDPGPIPESLAS